MNYISTYYNLKRQTESCINEYKYLMRKILNNILCL
jgi:hypothetical protein